MISYLKWVLLLALWGVILFFSKSLGINVILFIGPLMGYMYYVLKKNNKIKNPCGLLFMIPVLLLSFTYTLFDVNLFIASNVLAIPVFIALMVTYTTDETYNLGKLAERVIEYLLLPYNYIARLFRVTRNQLKIGFKLSDKAISILKALVIVIPITLVVLILLSSADMVFGNIFDGIWDSIVKFLKLEIFDNLLGRIIVFVLLFFAIGCTTMYIMYEKKKPEIVRENNKERNLLTAKILVSVLNIIYILFDFIQIKSLLFHSVSANINYASYARQGFFELLVVSLINLTIILATRGFETDKNKKEFNYIKIMNVIMIFLTMVIIASSFLRMHLYEMEYGYTTLRLLVFAALITEAILMIPTVMYIFNKEFNIVKSYMIILTIAYLCVNYMNFDYIIAKRNINRYYYTQDIDIDYLSNYQNGNVPLLIDFYDNLKDSEVKEELGEYLNNLQEVLNEDERGIFEFNLPYFEAEKMIEGKTFINNNYEKRDYLFR